MSKQLSKKQIIRNIVPNLFQQFTGRDTAINIRPYKPENFGKNSYRLYLSGKVILNSDEKIAMPENGFDLMPGESYILETTTYLRVNSEKITPSVTFNETMKVNKKQSQICFYSYQPGYYDSLAIKITPTVKTRVIQGQNIANLIFSKIRNRDSK